MAELVFHALPGSTGRTAHTPVQVLPDESLHSVLARGGVPISAMPLYVRLDGREVRSSDWWDTVVSDDARIDAQPLLQDTGGGDGGSDPVRALLILAVAVAAPWAAGALAASWGMGAVGAAVIGGVLTGVGMAAVNALVPPQVPEITQNLPGEGAAPTYAARSLGNRARPDQPLLLISGTYRVVPDLLCAQWRSNTRADIISDRKASIFGVYSMGLNTTTGAGDRLGDYELSNYNVQPLSYRQEPPDTGGSYIQHSDEWGHLPDFDDLRDVLDVGELFTGRSEDNSEPEAKEVIRAVPKGTARVDLDLTAQIYRVDPDTGEYIPTLHEVFIHYRREGGSTWLAAREIYTGDRPWPLGVWSRGRYNTATWPAQWESTALGSFYRMDGAYVNQPIDADGTHWRWLPWAMLYDTVGLVHPGAQTMTNKYTIGSHGPNVLYRTLSVHLNPSYAYEIRVSVEGREETSHGVRQIQWDRMHTIRKDPGHARLQRRRGLCLVGSADTAQVSGQYSAMVAGVWHSPLINAAYTGANPAHIFAAVAVGHRTGGRRIYGGKLAASDLDIPTLTQWGSYCDVMGFKSHRVWTSRLSLQDTLDQLAADGGAAVTWRAGKLSVVWAESDDPVVDRISMADMVKGGFAINYIRQALPAVCDVRFYNAADNDYKPDTLSINIPGGDPNLDPIDMEILGSTTAAKVLERARLAIARQFYDRRRTTITLDIAGFVYERGDVLELSHALCGWGYSGRLPVQASRSAVQLPQAVRLYGDDWRLYLRAPNGDMSDHAVVGEGDADTWTLATPMPAAVLERAEDYTWILDSGTTAGRRARIIEIKPQGTKQLEVVLADEVPAYYNQRTALTLPEPADEVTASPPVEDDGQPLYTLDFAALGWPGTLDNLSPHSGLLELVSGTNTGTYTSTILQTGTAEIHVPSVKRIARSHYVELLMRTGSSEANLLGHSFAPFSTQGLVASHIQVRAVVKRYANA